VNLDALLAARAALDIAIAAAEIPTTMTYTWIGPSPYPHGKRFRVWYRGADGVRKCLSMASEFEARQWIATNLRKVVKDGRTVDEALAAWLERLDVRGTTRTTNGYRMRSLIRDHGARHFETFPWVQAWNEGPAKQSRASQTGILSCLKRFLVFAKVSEKAIEGIEARGEVKYGKDQLGVDQSRRFLATAMKAGDPMALAAAVQVLCGLRSGEVVGLTVGDVDDGGRLLRVQGTKNRRARRVVRVDAYFAPWLMGLAAGRKSTDLLFPFTPNRKRGNTDPKKATSDALRRRVARLCVEADVPPVVPHGLRGTNASLRRIGGANDESITQALGHGHIDLTKRAYFAAGVQDDADAKCPLPRLFTGNSNGNSELPAGSSAVRSESAYNEFGNQNSDLCEDGDSNPDSRKSASSTSMPSEWHNPE
jgi:integrase